MSIEACTCLGRSIHFNFRNNGGEKNQSDLIKTTGICAYVEMEVSS